MQLTSLSYLPLVQKNTASWKRRGEEKKCAIEIRLDASNDEFLVSKCEKCGSGMENSS